MGEVDETVKSPRMWQQYGPANWVMPELALSVRVRPFPATFVMWRENND